MSRSPRPSSSSSTSSDRIATSVPPQNPSLLSIPKGSSASGDNDSPTTPTVAPSSTAAAATPINIRSGSSPHKQSSSDDEDALHNLSANDIDSSTAKSSTMGNASEMQVLEQMLGVMQNMQKELSRLSVRVEDIDSKTEMNAYNARRNSFYSGTIHTPGNMSPSLKSPGLFPKLGRRSSSPPKNTSMDNLIAAHLTANSSSPAQSAAPVIEEPKLGLWAVVPAGGAGTRLWPLSRESYPKFLLDLTGSGRTLLQTTWDRLLPLAGQSQMMIVTGQAHVNGVSGQLPELEQANVLAEPSPKESMAAIGLAAAVLLQRDPEAVLGSFAADHIISGREAFETAVTEAVATAKAGYLVTIGIAPSHPSTGFGYIKLGEKLKVSEAPNARRVDEFKEKPDAKTAAAYLQTGNYRWNGGMFVVKAKVLLDLLKETVPELHEGLTTIAAAWDSDAKETVMSEVWPTLPKFAIDHAVAEPASKVGKVAVIPATFGWDDVGDFASLADLIPAEEGEPRILGDSRLVITESQAGGLIVPAAGRPIACLGVDDVVIVDTPDALLITTRARSQDVKKIVGRTKKVYPELC